MSPIIELQRRMVEAGRIRAGEKGDKGEPRKLDKWRLTSKDRVRLEAAAGLWGGEVAEWDGQHELYTQTDTLPIMLLPGQLPTTWYELWSKGGCQRRCDGQHEVISDSACLCDDDRECKPYTRLSVLLPDLPGIGSWLLTSTGWNAASELAGAADLLQRAAAQGVLIPARLRLEQRVKITGGQTRRFAVPVIDIDTSFRELLGAQGALYPPSVQGALPSGYEPIVPREGAHLSLAAGLEQAESQTVSSRSAPIPPSGADEFLDAPVAVEDAGESAPMPAAGDSPAPTSRQKTKLGVLVKELRDEPDEPKITTEHLWAALAKSRKVEVDVMIELLKGRDDEGVLHFGPLLASLNRAEASDLIDRLERLKTNVEATHAV